MKAEGGRDSKYKRGIAKNFIYLDAGMLSSESIYFPEKNGWEFRLQLMEEPVDDISFDDSMEPHYVHPSLPVLLFRFDGRAAPGGERIFKFVGYE